MVKDHVFINKIIENNEGNCEVSVMVKTGLGVVMVGLDL
jgi:hypothetical protein